MFSLQQLVELKPSFETVVYYEDTENHKPDPEPLLLACQRMEVVPDEAVYVGDAVTDVQAAAASGMKMIAYSKGKLPGASVWTDSFKRIVCLVDSLG